MSLNYVMQGFIMALHTKYLLIDNRHPVGVGEPCSRKSLHEVQRTSKASDEVGSFAEKQHTTNVVYSCALLRVSQSVASGWCAAMNSAIMRAVASLEKIIPNRWESSSLSSSVAFGRCFSRIAPRSISLCVRSLREKFLI